MSSVHFPDTAKLKRLRELQAEMLTLGKAPVAMAKNQQVRLDNLKDRWDLSAESRQAGVQIERENFEREAAATLERFNAAKTERAKIIRELTAGHRQPPGTEQELQRQAAWARLERTLNTLDGNVIRYEVADKLLRQAAEVGDEATLQGARRELPAYLAGHGEPLPGHIGAWLDIVAGPEDAAQARLIEQESAVDLQVSEMAVGALATAASKGEVPATLPYPSGVEGQRVRGVTLEGESIVAKLPPQVSAE